MTNRLTRLTTAIGLLVLFGVTASASADERTPGAEPAEQAAAAGYKTATRLGGPSAFLGPVRDVAALKRMVSQPRVQRDIRTLLTDVGLGAKADDIIRIMTTGDGVSEVTVPIGQTWEWMALKRNRKPTVVRQVRWGGKAAFGAYQFVIDDMDRTYTFFIPKPCGNLALMTNEPSREKARRDAEERARQEKDRLAKEEADRRAKEEADRKAKEDAEADTKPAPQP